jgi:hypothetical protein
LKGRRNNITFHKENVLTELTLLGLHLRKNAEQLLFVTALKIKTPKAKKPTLFPERKKNSSAKWIPAQTLRPNWWQC